jgi:hypothetical protein
MKVSGKVGGCFYSGKLFFAHILAQHDAAYFRFVKGQMKNEVLISVTVDNALHYVRAVNFLRPARVSDV